MLYNAEFTFSESSGRSSLNDRDNFKLSDDAGGGGPLIFTIVVMIYVWLKLLCTFFFSFVRSNNKLSRVGKIAHFASTPPLNELYAEKFTGKSDFEEYSHSGFTSTPSRKGKIFYVAK